MGKKHIVMVEFMSDGQKEDTQISVFNNLSVAQKFYEKRIAENMESDWYQWYISHGAKILETADKTRENLEWHCSSMTDNYLIVRLITKIENQED